MDIKNQIAQMYFQEQVPKGAIAVMLNVKRRAVCRVLAEWNEIARAFYLLESRSYIRGDSINEEIHIRLDYLLHL